MHKLTENREDRQDRCTKGKICLTSLAVYCEEIDDSVGKRRVVDVLTRLVVNLASLGLDKWPVRWMENWLGHKL